MFFVSPNPGIILVSNPEFRKFSIFHMNKYFNMKMKLYGSDLSDTESCVSALSIVGCLLLFFVCSPCFSPWFSCGYGFWVLGFGALCVSYQGCVPHHATVDHLTEGILLSFSLKFHAAFPHCPPCVQTFSSFSFLSIEVFYLCAHFTYPGRFSLLCLLLSGPRCQLRLPVQRDNGMGRKTFLGL